LRGRSQRLDATSGEATVRRYVTELVGTFLLVLTVGLVVLGESEAAPMAIGLVVAVIVYAGYHVSGSQYNPVVTLAVLVRGVLPAREVAPYVGAQVLGALGGAATASFLVPDGARPGLTFTGNAVPAALITEFVFTFALLWVILHVATSPKHAGNSYYGLAIGAVVTVGVVAAADISGGVVNPAVAVALAMMGVLSWSSLWIYVTAQVAGALAAAYLYRCCDLPPGAQPPRDAPAAEAARGRHSLVR
jgi:aquaporin Z